MVEVKPAIIVMKHTCMGDETLDLICQGVEEESIPWEILEDPETTAAKLAYQAALASRLDVGIGVGQDGVIAVHHAALQPEMPLMASGKNPEGPECVMLGKNAARLVKGLPLSV